MILIHIFQNIMKKYNNNFLLLTEEPTFHIFRQWSLSFIRDLLYLQLWCDRNIIENILNPHWKFCAQVLHFRKKENKYVEKQMIEEV